MTSLVEHIFHRSGIRVLAHRGRPGPENTIPAILEQLQREGCDGVEIDVRLTADDELVVFHDEDTSRIFPNTPIIRIREARIADLVGIPKLAEVLSLPGEGKCLNLELKAESGEGERLREAVRRKLERTSSWRHIFMSSFYPACWGPDCLRLSETGECGEIVDKRHFISGTHLGCYTLAENGYLDAEDYRVLDIVKMCRLTQPLLLITDDVALVRDYLSR